MGVNVGCVLKGGAHADHKLLHCSMCAIFVQEGLRPRFTFGTPHAYQALAEACWQNDWEERWVMVAHIKPLYVHLSEVI
jgi:hypothetical protein